MVVQTQDVQRIARLMPLAEALAVIDAVAPVAARDIDVGAALGRCPEHDVCASGALPAAPLALHDGWAVRAHELMDASAYAPVPLTRAPDAIETGEPLPPDADTVATPDAIVIQDAGAAAVVEAMPGEGVLASATDARADGVLRGAGERLRGCNVAAFAALGIATLRVRVPRVRVVLSGRPGRVSEAARGFLANALRACGAMVEQSDGAGSGALEAALRDETADAVIGVGGTGSGRSDAAVRILARLGELRFHGVGLSPGETAAFGFAFGRPVLLVPGRLDAAVAVWLLLGRRMLDRLCGAAARETAHTLALTRKVSSTIGVASVVPVRRCGEAAEPLASGYLPLQSLAQADGWILVAPESEGYAKGARVAVRALP